VTPYPNRSPEQVSAMPLAGYQLPRERRKVQRVLNLPLLANTSPPIPNHATWGSGSRTPIR